MNYVELKKEDIIGNYNITLDCSDLLPMEWEYRDWCDCSFCRAYRQLLKPTHEKH